MAGGIYVDQPFHPNPKCIIFGGALMGGFYLTPEKKKEIFTCIF